MMMRRNWFVSFFSSPSSSFLLFLLPFISISPRLKYLVDFNVGPFAAPHKSPTGKASVPEHFVRWFIKTNPRFQRADYSWFISPSNWFATLLITLIKPHKKTSTIIWKIYIGFNEIKSLHHIIYNVTSHHIKYHSIEISLIPKQIFKLFQ